MKQWSVRMMWNAWKDRIWKVWWNNDCEYLTDGLLFPNQRAGKPFFISSLYNTQILMWLQRSKENDHERPSANAKAVKTSHIALQRRCCQLSCKNIQIPAGDNFINLCIIPIKEYKFLVQNTNRNFFQYLLIKQYSIWIHFLQLMFWGYLSHISILLGLPFVTAFPRSTFFKVARPGLLCRTSKACVCWLEDYGCRMGDHWAWGGFVLCVPVLPLPMQWPTAVATAGRLPARQPASQQPSHWLLGTNPPCGAL